MVTLVRMRQALKIKLSLTLPLCRPAAKNASELLSVDRSIISPFARVGLKVNATIKDSFILSTTSFSAKAT